jgi:RNA polymerase sigma factor (sigma-70 family)
MKPTAPNNPRPGNAGYVAAAVVLGAGLANLAGTAHADPGAIQDLSRYCTACWRNARLHPDSWADCTQEVFCRLLKTVPDADWGQMLANEGDERREFLRAIDAVKKRTQRARRLAPLPPDVAAPGVAQLATSEELEGVRNAAARLLTTRQGRILELSLAGWTVQEIAEKLETPAARISDEKYKAIRKIGRHLQLI